MLMLEGSFFILFLFSLVFFGDLVLDAAVLAFMRYWNLVLDAAALAFMSEFLFGF